MDILSSKPYPSVIPGFLVYVIVNKDDALNNLCGKSHTFVAIEHEIIFMAILLPSADSRRVVVSYKRKYVHKVLVNCLVKFAQEKVWLVELTVST